MLVAVAVAVSASPAGAAYTVYVPNFGSNDVSAFTVGADGALTPVPGSPFPDAGSSPVSAAVSPDGRNL